MSDLVIWIVASVLVIGGGIAGFSHHRAVTAERDLAQQALKTCQAANRNNETVIEELRATAADNEAKYLAAQERARQAVERVKALEVERDERLEASTVTIASADPAYCLDEYLLPDSLGVLLDPGSDHRIPDG